MIDTPHIAETECLPAAVIHLDIPRARMQEEMEPAIGELTGVLREQGIEPAGPLFAHHLTTSSERFDLEVGFPVNRPVADAGRVRASDLPGARVARAVYRGPYEGLFGAWSELGAWMKEQGLEGRGSLWERYVSGPESSDDPKEWATELNRPLAD